MNKYIPNILSIIRIIFSLLLIFLLESPFIFILFYLIIGLTDILDGFVARKYETESNLGARLDSIADFVFYIILTFIFINLYFSILTFNHKIILLGIIIIRIFNLLLTKIKYREFVFVHTIANKASGILLFLLPVILLLIKSKFIIMVIFILVFLAALEELLITIIYSEVKLNRKSIFLK